MWVAQGRHKAIVHEEVIRGSLPVGEEQGRTRWDVTSSADLQVGVANDASPRGQLRQMSMLRSFCLTNLGGNSNPWKLE
jgi:hypothetical protein